MDVRVLGPVELIDGASIVRLPPAQRTLLAALASRLGERVAVDVLEEALWPEQPPPSARKTLQGLVVRLRRAVGGSAIVERDGGYLLDPDVVTVDAARIATEVGEARAAIRAGDPETAAALLAQASPAFRGEPYESVDEVALPAGEVARLQELKTTVVEEAAEAELACGRGHERLEELEALVQANPYRERAWGLLMRALYQAGRPADALGAYGRARVVLAAELGIEPGPALRAVEQAILSHDAQLLTTAVSPEQSNLPAPSAGPGDAAALPSGVVTFLFTDLEDSTTLLQRLGRRYGPLQERYRAILRAAVAAAGGVEVATLGDGLLVVFADSSAAIGAAVAGQRALGAEAWPSDAAVHIRMGIASGEAVPSGSDYPAEAVNRAARICDAAHGGQVLVAEESALLAGSTVASQCTVVELGRYRLQGFAQPALLFELRGDGIESAFPALRVLPAVHHNLPATTSAFIGREATVRSVSKLLTEARLVTLIGPGGVGKTRVALEVAAGQVDHHEHGVWFVDLAPVFDGELVPGRIAEAIGVRVRDDESALEAVERALQDRRSLLVLDNCEQVLEDSARGVDRILAASPGVRVLTTSRQQLAVAGEHVFPIPPLDVPAAEEISADMVLASESVRLFLQRATERRPDLEVCGDELSALIDIVTRLDGMPLAIELAAARVTVLSIAEVARLLNDRFRLLGAGPSTAPPRQQTLAAAIDWSHESLSPPERAVFRRLSVFAAGFSLDGAEAVADAGDLGGGWILDLIGGLVGKSLLSVDFGTDGARYRYLETIRDYARLRLTEANEDVETRARHEAWLLDVVERAHPQLNGPDSGRWLNELEAYHDDIRSALEFGIDSGRRGTALRLAVAVAPFWLSHGHANEGRAWLEETLAESAEVASESRIRGFTWLADLAFFGRRDSTRGVEACRTAIDLARSVGNLAAEATALASLGNMLIHLGRGEEARPPLTRAIELSRQVGELATLADALTYLGAFEGWSGGYDEGRRMLMEARSLHGALGDQRRAVWTIQMLGELATEQARYNESQQWHEEALAIAVEIGDRHSTARLFGCLAHCHLAIGDLRSASHFAEQYLVGSREFGDRAGICYSLADLGEIARLSGDLTAARLLLEESIEAIPEGTDVYSLLISLHRLGAVARLEGDFEAANNLELESLRLARQAGDIANISQALEGLAQLAVAQARHQRAVFLFAVSAANRHRFGLPVPTYLQQERDDDLELSHNALDKSSYAESWAQGFDAPVDALVESLLGGNGALVSVVDHRT